MIVKAVPRATGRSFLDTAAYLFGRAQSLNPARWQRERSSTGDRVAAAWTTNCAVADPGLAIVEIDSMLRRRGKRQVRATYHLIISLAPGETVDDVLLRKFEKALLDGVGIGHHPRVAVRHADCNHAHLHILASRIDPISDRVAQLPYDHRRLMQISRAIEDRYGLVQAYHGEYRGRGPIPPDTRQERHDPYLGMTDALLAARVMAKFSFCRASTYASRRDINAQLRRDAISRKVALEAEIASKERMVRDAHASDQSAARQAIRALRAERGQLLRSISASAADRKRDIMASLPIPEWATWLEAEAKRGDRDAVVLLAQAKQRADQRRANEPSCSLTQREGSLHPKATELDDFRSRDSMQAVQAQRLNGCVRPSAAGSSPTSSETHTIASEEGLDAAVGSPEHAAD